MGSRITGTDSPADGIRGPKLSASAGALGRDSARCSVKVDEAAGYGTPLFFLGLTCNRILSLFRKHAVSLASNDEITEILESLVADNEALVQSNTELQSMLADTREELHTLQEEAEERRAGEGCSHLGKSRRIMHVQVLKPDRRRHDVLQPPVVKNAQRARISHDIRNCTGPNLSALVFASARTQATAFFEYRDSSPRICASLPHSWPVSSFNDTFRNLSLH
jgi:hypothetical protein